MDKENPNIENIVALPWEVLYEPDGERITASELASTLMREDVPYQLLDPSSNRDILNNISSESKIHIRTIGYGDRGLNYIDNGIDIMDQHPDIEAIEAKQFVDFHIEKGLRKDHDVTIFMFTSKSAVDGMEGSAPENIQDEKSYAKLLVQEFRKANYNNVKIQGLGNDLTVMTLPGINTKYDERTMVSLSGYGRKPLQSIGQGTPSRNRR
ncbi:hypothetical protein [Zobellia galactanivorans]|uniref:Uncharacterized protein n=1 Tax=Zobellia galactanivorans (strain DSM 12802 / CCUG 47099 / CIP 106680 / NCIMB 13871 / Dsij) TaxID=63186 RepID=G0KZW1_ZOBGA|nr:hypothetical protein [Zobellia galactanivorans]CAZ97217.1 Hypothetical protein ZOBELLIA_3078 [Zobellia galactanivorans]